MGKGKDFKIAINKKWQKITGSKSRTSGKGGEILDAETMQKQKTSPRSPMDLTGSLRELERADISFERSTPPKKAGMLPRRYSTKPRRQHH